MPPEDRLDRLPKVRMRYLTVRPHLIDQRLPLLVRQDVNAGIAHHHRHICKLLSN